MNYMKLWNLSSPNDVHMAVDTEKDKAPTVLNSSPSPDVYNLQNTQEQEQKPASILSDSKLTAT